MVGAQQLLHPEREIDGDKNDDHRGEYEGQDEQGPSEAPAGGQHTANTGSWITCQGNAEDRGDSPTKSSDVIRETQTSSALLDRKVVRNELW